MPAYQVVAEFWGILLVLVALLPVLDNCIVAVPGPDGVAVLLDPDIP